jgi:hypothetical protein
VYRYLPAVLAAGLVGEAIWAWMRRGGEGRLTDPMAYRILAGCVPLVLYGVYFLSAALTANGVVWPVHLWAGAIGMSAIAGTLLSSVLIRARHA